MAVIEEVARDCININGPIKQIQQANKEMIELMLELNNLMDGKGNPDKVASELADVRFTLMQVEMLLDSLTGGKFKKVYEVELCYKVDRQAARNDIDRHIYADGKLINKEASDDNSNITI